MSDVKDFLKELSRNPEAVKLLKQAKEPAGIEEAAALYAEIANKTGISVSRETILELLQKKESIQQDITAKAEGAVKEALDEDALENVAGGAGAECESTVNQGEWCWFSDGCAYVINYYEAEKYHDSEDIFVCENLGNNASFKDAADGWEDWDAICKGLPDSEPDYGPDEIDWQD